MAPLLTYLLTYLLTDSLNYLLTQLLLTHLLCSSKPLTLLSIDQSIDLTVCLLFPLNRYRDRPSSGATVHYTDGLTLD